jgi:hemerythrin-like metal-binding protein
MDTRIQMEISASILHAAPAILEASSEAIATLDPAGRVLSGNSRFYRLLNMVPQDGGLLNINQLFEETGLEALAEQSQDEYEPVRLTRPDASHRWVLVKVIRMTGSDAAYRTILIQDPEVIRRVIDRLDYVESYDVDSGLLNRRTGLAEFKQLQVSDRLGGCYLARLADAEEAQVIAALVALSQHFKPIGGQQIICRYSALEILFVFALDVPLDKGACEAVVRRIQADSLLCADTLLLGYVDWSGRSEPVDAIIAQLRSRLTGLTDPRLVDDCWAKGSFESRNACIASMEAALNHDQFVFYIQPQIAAQTREVVGGELLIRWIAGDGEVIQPSRFVEYLEEGAFADQFLVWSIRQAAMILVQIKQATGCWRSLSLNVAPSQFTEDLLLHNLLKVFDEFAVPREYLEVEITERVLAEDPRQVMGVLRQLQNEGFRMAIDDFGTGYSSLSYLRQFPLDRLKIDRVFVTNLADNEEDRLISTAIASLAHVLGLEVVVEGVENAAQARFLQQIGCEYFQGYLTGKPMPVDAFIDFCENRPGQAADALSQTGFRQDGAVDQNGSVLSWKKGFSTDLVSVDNEHRDLIEALNAVAAAYADDPGKVNLLEAVDMIGTETMRHFEHEEQVMRNIQYSRYEAHKEKHRWLIADLSKRRNALRVKGEPVDFDELMQYLKYWLLRHLISEDTRLHRFINRSSTERRMV